MSRLAGLRHLHLCLSLQMPWSTYFSPAQTSRFVSAIENLHTLAFLDFADDPFIEEVGRQCFNVGLYLSIHLDPDADFFSSKYFQGNWMSKVLFT